VDSGFHTIVVKLDNLRMVTQREAEIWTKRCRSIFKSGYSLTEYQQKGARWSRWASDQTQCHARETVPGIECLSLSHLSERTSGDLLSQIYITEYM